MRVAHNIPSMTALRNLGTTTTNTRKNLERLSSGMKINSAADGPAQLMISERMRSQIAGIRQAIDNSETSVSMIQTAEGALQEVSNILINLRQLAIHAANEGANDSKMLEADQSEITNLLSSMDRIAKYTQFGSKTLLDGSNGANGVAVGEGLLFVHASTETQPSPESGFEVDITQVATQSEARAARQLTMDDAEKAISFVINEGGKTASLNTGIGEVKAALDKIIGDYKASPDSYPQELAITSIREIVARNLQRAAEENGLNVDVSIDKTGLLMVKHKEFGSSHSFSVTSNVDGVLSAKANVAKEATKGKDVAGFIGGEIALGKGQFLTAVRGTRAEGLTVQMTKTLGTRVEETIDPETGAVTGRQEVNEDNNALVGKPIDGYVHVSQRSLQYQIGPNKGQFVKLSLASISSNRLSRGIANESKFNSLADVDVTTAKGAQDTIGMIDRAITEVSELRASMGSFQKNALETSLNSLRVADENLTNAESILRDSDMAHEMSEFTKNQIMLQSGTAMSAQANQIPKAVLELLGSGRG